jgi:hypothetical protein
VFPYNESNFSISACEYDAPTTIFGSRPDFLGDEARRVTEGRVRQKGEFDLRQSVLLRYKDLCSPRTDIDVL